MDVMAMLDQGSIVAGYLGTGLQSEYIKTTACFTVAAWLHRRWVKQDIAGMTSAINNVADKLTAGFESHSKKIDDLTARVENLESSKK